MKLAIFTDTEDLPVAIPPEAVSHVIVELVKKKGETDRMPRTIVYFKGSESGIYLANEFQEVVAKLQECATQ